MKAKPAKNVWKPTAEECAQIRAYAKRRVLGLKKLEPGLRYNREDESVSTSINIARVTKHSDGWEDTDLSDFSSWAAFRKGVELTDDGKAIVDFYAYDTWELRDSVVVYYKDGAILAIANTSTRPHNF